MIRFRLTAKMVSECGNVFRTLMAIVCIVSCQKAVQPEMQQAIGFSYSVLDTRATITSGHTIAQDAVDNGTGFGVVGYRNLSGWDKTFDNKLVSPETPLADPVSWTYQDPQFWEYCPYRFFAYYPYSAAASLDLSKCLENTESNVAFGVTYTVPNSWTTSYVDEQMDFLLATPKSVSTNDNGEVVAFDFKHALCQVGFRLSKSSDEGSLEIVDLQLRNLNSKAPATIKADGTISWGYKSAPLHYSFKSKAGGMSIPVSPEYAEVPCMLLLPQGFNDTNWLMLTVKDKSQNNKAWTLSGQLGQVPKWEPGKKYIYTLTINSDPLLLDMSLEIANWTDVKIDVTI